MNDSDMYYLRTLSSPVRFGHNASSLQISMYCILLSARLGQAVRPSYGCPYNLVAVPLNLLPKKGFSAIQRASPLRRSVMFRMTSVLSVRCLLQAALPPKASVEADVIKLSNSIVIANYRDE